jgi:alkaline phosphatase D
MCGDGRGHTDLGAAMLTRRDLLRLGMVGAGSALAGCEGAPRVLAADAMSDSSGVPPPSGAPLVDEPVAAFEVESSRALIWTRASRATRARVEVATMGGSNTSLSSWFALAESGTGSVDLVGLFPATQYLYRVEFSHGVSAWHHLTTAPAPTVIAPVHFLYSADISRNPAWYSDIIDRMIGGDADFYLHLGDWPYADAEPAAYTVDEYREKYRLSREPQRIRDLMQRFPLRCIYDDHDVRCNWDASWRETEAERIDNGIRVWDEYFPLRTATRYRSFRWGRCAEFFVLDTRLYRSANASEDGADKTMLGAAQKAWLLNSLRQSNAEFKLVVSSVPLSYATGNDNWASFAAERGEIIDFIRANGISGVLFLTADRHYFAALKHDSGVREFHVGPLSAGPGNPPDAGPEVLAVYNGLNYGEVVIAPGDPSVLTFCCRDHEGDVKYQETLSPNDLLLT